MTFAYYLKENWKLGSYAHFQYQRPFKQAPTKLWPYLVGWLR